MTDETNERLARIETHLEGVLLRLDRLSEIPLTCARNNERIDAIEREHRTVKRSIWGIIGSSIVAIGSAVVAFLLQR